MERKKLRRLYLAVKTAILAVYLILLLIEALADPASLEVQEPTGIRRVEERRRA